MGEPWKFEDLIETLLKMRLQNVDENVIEGTMVALFKKIDRTDLDAIMMAHPQNAFAPKLREFRKFERDDEESV